MPFLPAFLLLMAQSASTGTAEIAVVNRRPSSLLAAAKGLGGTFVAHDERGTIGVTGTLEQIGAAREFVKLVDVPRRSVLLRITVESPVDHLTWEVDARLTSGQRWRTADDETGTEIALEPRADADGTLTMRLVATCSKGELKTTLRIAKGESMKLAMGGKGVREIHVESGERPKVQDSQIPLPNITLRYVGG